MLSGTGCKDRKDQLKEEGKEGQSSEGEDQETLWKGKENSLLLGRVSSKAEGRATSIDFDSTPHSRSDLGPELVNYTPLCRTRAKKLIPNR